jgi:hypothetical protein
MKFQHPLGSSLRSAALLAAMSGLAGCVATAPDYESRFGDAARQTRAAQVIDPQAPMRNTDAPVIDGKATAGVVRAYADTYGYGVKEPRQPALTLTTTGGR